METLNTKKNRKILPGGILIILLVFTFVSASDFEIAEWKGTHNQTILEEGELQKESDAKLIFTFDDEENVFKDVSVFNNQIKTNSPSKSTDCKFGNTCLEFDGIDDYLFISEINPSLNFSGETEITLSAWINLKAVEDAQEDWILVRKNGVFHVRMSIYRSKLYCYSINEVGISTQIGKPLTLKENNQWFNIACAFDFNNDMVTYYQSGLKIGEEDFIGEHFEGEGKDFLIGKNGGNTQYFKGKMQCLQAWNKSLTIEEIQTINNSESCNENYLDPKATFKMEEYSKEIQNYNNNKNNADIGAFFTEEGKLNGGIEFDGIDDSITITNSSSSLHFSNNYFSISGWFKSKTNNSAQRNILLGKYGGGSTYQWDIEVDATKKLVGNIYKCNGINVISTKSNALVNDNVWHHFVALYYTSPASENVRLFIDGAETSTLIADTSLINDYCTDTKGDAVIGARNPTNPEHFFNGTIDELQIFNRTLSEEEIKELYEESQHFIYQKANYQSVIHSSLDYTNVNNFKWKSVEFKGELKDSTLKSKSGNCDEIESKEFQNATKEENIFFLDNATEQCMQFELYLGDTRSLTPSLDSYIINIEEITTNPPLITILNPKDGSTHNNKEIKLEISIEDLVSSIDSCWYNLENINTTFNCLSNTTITGKEGENNIKVYINNSLNKINMSESKFTIETKEKIKETPEQTSSSSSSSSKETGGSQKGILISEQKDPINTNQIKKESKPITNNHGTTQIQEEIQTIKIREKPIGKETEVTNIQIPIKFKLSLILITTTLGIIFIITTLKYTPVKNIKPKLMRNKIQEIIDSVTRERDVHARHKPRYKFKIY